ncbi:hypothetical protein EHZ64_11195 [Aeromonas enteropelogenes]|nr:hypothetical protein EHZ64_11195 [Aeromonas enteropelogenes]
MIQLLIFLYFWFGEKEIIRKTVLVSYVRVRLKAAIDMFEVKQAQKRSEHWFGKMPATAKKS